MPKTSNNTLTKKEKMPPLVRRNIEKFLGQIKSELSAHGTFKLYYTTHYRTIEAIADSFKTGE